MDTLVLILLLLAVLAFLIWVGYQLGRNAEQEELSDQRQVLDAEWSALEQTRRVHDVFFRARDALRRVEEDARRDRKTPP
jgi:hypothetical protein